MGGRRGCGGRGLSEEYDDFICRAGNGSVNGVLGGWDRLGWRRVMGGRNLRTCRLIYILPRRLGSMPRLSYSQLEIGMERKDEVNEPRLITFPIRM